MVSEENLILCYLFFTMDICTFRHDNNCERKYSVTLVLRFIKVTALSRKFDMRFMMSIKEAIKIE